VGGLEKILVSGHNFEFENETCETGLGAGLQRKLSCLTLNTKYGDSLKFLYFFRLAHFVDNPTTPGREITSFELLGAPSRKSR